MTPEMVIDIFRDAMQIVVVIVALLVCPGLGVGLVISIFQAATQINEQTLSFIPRLLITMFALMMFGSWILKYLIHFTTELINNINQYIA